jgi:hypothetical protein
MVKYLAGVLSVIAVGILLIAYGLLAPRASAFGPYGDPGMAGPMLAGQQLPLTDDPYYARYGFNYPNPAAVPAAYYPMTATAPMRALPVAAPALAPQRVVTRTVAEKPGRNWGKTALVIGGSTAAGAGIGGIVGGKKGALIGAAIGGGGSTIFESLKK